MEEISRATYTSCTYTTREPRLVRQGKQGKLRSVLKGSSTRQARFFVKDTSLKSEQDIATEP